MVRDEVLQEEAMVSLKRARGALPGFEVASTTANIRDRAYRRGGAEGVALSQDGDGDVDGEVRNIRIPRQRAVADFAARVMERLV